MFADSIVYLEERIRKKQKLGQSSNIVSKQKVIARKSELSRRLQLRPRIRGHTGGNDFS